MLFVVAAMYLLQLLAYEKTGLLFNIGALQALRQLGLLEHCTVVVSSGTANILAYTLAFAHKNLMIKQVKDDRKLDVIHECESLLSDEKETMDDTELTQDMNQYISKCTPWQRLTGAAFIDPTTTAFNIILRSVSISFCLEAHELNACKECLFRPWRFWAPWKCDVESWFPSIPGSNRMSRLITNQHQDGVTFCFTGAKKDTAQLVCIHTDQKKIGAKEDIARCKGLVVLEASNNMPATATLAAISLLPPFDQAANSGFCSSIDVNPMCTPVCEIFSMQHKLSQLNKIDRRSAHHILIDGFSYTSTAEEYCSENTKNLMRAHVDSLLGARDVKDEVPRAYNQQIVQMLDPVFEQELKHTWYDVIRAAETRLEAVDPDLARLIAAWGLLLTFKRFTDSAATLEPVARQIYHELGHDHYGFIAAICPAAVNEPQVGVSVDSAQFTNVCA
jgi:hypothetical protein